MDRGTQQEMEPNLRSPNYKRRAAISFSLALLFSLTNGSAILLITLLFLGFSESYAPVGSFFHSFLDGPISIYNSLFNRFVSMIAIPILAIISAITSSVYATKGIRRKQSRVLLSFILLISVFLIILPSFLFLVFSKGLQMH